jgi:hypothetical protein
MTREERELTQDMLELIEKIKHKTDFISADDRIPELEFEVLLSKIEKLHQKAIGLKYLHQYADELRSSVSVEAEPQIKPSIKVEEITVAQAQEKPAVKIKEEPIAKEEVNLAALQKDMASIEVNDTSTAIEDIGAKLQQQPISDLKGAIGINDKFLYTNELFGGNPQEFESVINSINQLSSFDEAQQILNKYHWEKDNETVQSFLSLVARRYL